ncbi:hypothetical protein [Draconibacterium sediminis]|uniref:Uncharacterized protein n=1 Tax=Draconibacterium sediminis TaxID=1544798 RepID=A0A0D8JEN6_9BACT|nr:hypothetical protein [Draconibacterium sediminis]KJF45365.1 hypothetical protein LH29_08320 [Draconibacterium sediminis]
MKKIEVYECSYCEKRSYKLKASCAAHERKCFFNPVTRSCASCAYSRFSNFSVHKGAFTKLGTCLLNENILEKKRTQCEKYLSRDDRRVWLSIFVAQIKYNAIPYVEEHLRLRFPDKKLKVRDLQPLKPLKILQHKYTFSKYGISDRI